MQSSSVAAYVPQNVPSVQVYYQGIPGYGNSNTSSADSISLSNATPNGTGAPLSPLPANSSASKIPWSSIILSVGVTAVAALVLILALRKSSPKSTSLTLPKPENLKQGQPNDPPKNANQGSEKNIGSTSSRTSSVHETDADLGPGQKAKRRARAARTVEQTEAIRRISAINHAQASENEEISRDLGHLGGKR